MNLDWNDSRCIVCLHEAPLTLEHVIPRSLAGILTVRFLCKTCNDTLGHREEALAKKDPAIKLAIEQLRSSLPHELFTKLIEGQDYYAESSRGMVRGHMEHGSFRVKTSQEPDGSIILPTEKGKDFIEEHLEKAHTSEESINDKLQRFDSAPEDTHVPIDEELTVVKWSMGTIRPTLDGEPVTDGAVLKMAYEFLACILGKAISHGVPVLSEARDILRDGKALGPKVQVERLRAPKYDAFHGLAFEGNQPHAVIQVRLFGWLAFRVHFHEIAINAPRIVYTHRLDTGVDAWGVMPTGAHEVV